MYIKVDFISSIGLMHHCNITMLSCNTLASSICGQYCLQHLCLFVSGTSWCGLRGLVMLFSLCSALTFKTQRQPETSSTDVWFSVLVHFNHLYCESYTSSFHPQWHIEQSPLNGSVTHYFVQRFPVLTNDWFIPVNVACLHEYLTDCCQLLVNTKY